ncbi:hypothetical protein Maq22A_c28470 [Methylobacterium aquaticum]|uniref:Uncharacterized protein n=1 Tax=Methylobacterium aquaticum TaxID=270351 RepID=A0A1Y0ZBV6_9HYPH|nr:hypothetical protein Maq22A_c28470 [Methylobacterium aquaticum]
MQARRGRKGPGVSAEGRAGRLPVPDPPPEEGPPAAMHPGAGRAAIRLRPPAASRRLSIPPFPVQQYCPNSAIPAPDCRHDPRRTGIPDPCGTGISCTIDGLPAFAGRFAGAAWNVGPSLTFTG